MSEVSSSSGEKRGWLGERNKVGEAMVELRQLGIDGI